MTKILVVLIDGLADVQYSEWRENDIKISSQNRLSPLEVAETPWMDKMSAMGTNGLMDPVSPGLACGSDTAHLALFGNDPMTCYRGRGAFESMGAGMSMLPGDIAFKSNFAVWEKETNIVLSRRADRHFEEEGPILCAALNGLTLLEFPGYEIAVQYATEHRCGVRIRGPGLSDAITGTDPLKDDLPLKQCQPTDNSSEAKFTCRLIEALTKTFHEKLSEHPINKQRIAQGKQPANMILLRGCGSRLQLPSFYERYNLSSFMIAPTCIISGLGQTLEMKICRVEGATGDYRTNLIAKADAALEAIKQHDFGFIHIKAVDDAGHDKKADLKVHFLERIDVMLGYLIEKLNDSVVLCVTGDHATPVSYGDHRCEPVPIVMTHCNQGQLQATVLTDRVTRFNEKSCSQGFLGRFGGRSFMRLLLAFSKINTHVKP